MNSNGSLSLWAEFIDQIYRLAGMGLNYPIYKRIMKKSKEKYSYEIIQLAKKVCDK